jgi:hypothetical protein
MRVVRRMVPTPVTNAKVNANRDCHKGTAVRASRIGMASGEVSGMRLSATAKGLLGALRKMLIDQAGISMGNITKN